jgi:hypothetical protein
MPEVPTDLRIADLRDRLKVTTLHVLALAVVRLLGGRPEGLRPG